MNASRRAGAFGGARLGKPRCVTGVRVSAVGGGTLCVGMQAKPLVPDTQPRGCGASGLARRNDGSFHVSTFCLARKSSYGISFVNVGGGRGLGRRPTRHDRKKFLLPAREKVIG
jgi:hypothetical protein